MTEGSSALLRRLQQLQCHFTWDLKKDVDLKNLSTRLQDHIKLQLGQRGAVARSYSFLAYVRYSFHSSGHNYFWETEEPLSIKQLHSALELNPDDAVLQSMLAVKLAAYKKYEEAVGLLKKALKTDPDNPHVSRYVGKYFRNHHRLDESIDMLERALKRATQSSFIHHQLALCYKRKKIAEQSRKPFSSQREVRYWRRCCIREFEMAVKIKPTFHLAWADLALLYAEERNLRRAEEIFQQCLLKLPECNERLSQAIHQRYGDFHYHHKRNEAQAIVHYTKGLLIPLKKYEKKVCAKKLKQIAEKLLARNPGDGEALALLGQVARAEGNRKEAAEFYEKALNCDKDNEEYLSALYELRLQLQGSSSD
ncbi:interferon-induced protein with tetratricopeptide repeats 1-like [Oreochromis aureus]|uniref:interferon-induced protein with tetratricopeptide repeats 1-like n=1 Tax=Oreochromis aureus TaxID=47969 RepID=UPI001952B1B8|nr:interferon-induced protein with tetratricopeptide repeats 1-like [Oreochromis aureus]